MNRFLLAFGLVIALAVPALADDTEVLNDVAGHFGVFGTFGYSAYIIGNEFNYINQLLGGKQALVFNGDISGGAGVTYGLSKYWQAGVEASALGAQTQGKDRPGPVAPVPLPAWEFGAFIKLLWPAAPWWSYAVGLGVYDLQVNDTEKISLPDGSPSPAFSGSTPAIKFWIGGEHFYSRQVSLGVDLGYRFANLSDLNDTRGGPWLNRAGNKLGMNYGGPYLRIALQVYF
jgi:hypothetical protein